MTDPLLTLTVRWDRTYDYHFSPGANRATVIALLRDIANQIEKQQDFPDPVLD